MNIFHIITNTMYMEDIKNIKVWKILIYFIIYSIIGFFIETIYAIFTKGMLESRKSFLYGPFCAIYGIAAILMIITLENYKKNPLKIFVFGSIIGLAIEYIFSFLGEIIFHARWWDYSNNVLNINGRICVFYAIMWGILSLLLIYIIHPNLEKRFDFLKNKNNITNLVKSISVITILFLSIDSIITFYALKNFINDVSLNYGIEICNFESKNYEKNFFTTYFSNEKMIMNYPNISIITTNNEVLYLGSVLNQYKNYYYRFGND